MTQGGRGVLCACVLALCCLQALCVDRRPQLRSAALLEWRPSDVCDGGGDPQLEWEDGQSSIHDVIGRWTTACARDVPNVQVLALHKPDTHEEQSRSVWWQTAVPALPSFMRHTIASGCFDDADKAVIPYVEDVDGHGLPLKRLADEVADFSGSDKHTCGHKEQAVTVVACAVAPAGRHGHHDARGPAKMTCWRAASPTHHGSDSHVALSMEEVMALVETAGRVHVVLGSADEARLGDAALQFLQHARDAQRTAALLVLSQPYAQAAANVPTPQFNGRATRSHRRQLQDDAVIGTATSIEFVRMTPDIATGLLVSAFLIGALLVTLSCLFDVQTPSKFVSKPLPPGKEF